MLALAQSCKYLRMVHGLALAWIPRSDDARLILGEFLRTAPDVTSATLHASVRLPLSTLRLGRKGHVIMHGKQRGSVHETASSMQVEQNAHGCRVSAVLGPSGPHGMSISSRATALLLWQDTATPGRAESLGCE